MTNVLYMACNVTHELNGHIETTSSIGIKKTLRSTLSSLERCNQLYRDEYDPTYDIFDIEDP